MTGIQPQQRALIDGRLAAVETVIANMRAALGKNAMAHPGEAFVGPFDVEHEELIAEFLSLQKRWLGELQVDIVDHYGCPSTRKNIHCLWRGGTGK